MMISFDEDGSISTHATPLRKVVDNPIVAENNNKDIEERPKTKP